MAAQNPRSGNAHLVDLTDCSENGLYAPGYAV